MRKVTPVLLFAVIFGIFGTVQAQTTTRTGDAAFGDYTTDAPGVRRLIKPSDLPKPFATATKRNPATSAAPDGALPLVPKGFTVAQFAQLKAPRLIRVAPNGDIFVSETAMRQVTVLHAAPGATAPSTVQTFASDLPAPFGIAFYPAGPNPQYIYIANETSVVRFPYRSGDLKARGSAETIIPNLPNGGHSTRDIVFSPDGSRLYVSVGSESNVDETTRGNNPTQMGAAEAKNGLGASWGDEAERADVLFTDPDGHSGLHSFANGIRNCVGMALQPVTKDLWCATNERDMLGDNLPPDYVTRVAPGAFYGWPWYYIGANEDPRHKGERPDLADKITVPDVLIQPHSAPLEMTFYTGDRFPAAYRGDAFVALHGSWNRSIRTGYKVVRIILKDGKPTGEYEDFITGLVGEGGKVKARPVGVAVAQDGALLVTEDDNGTVWRIDYTGNGSPE